MRVPGQHDETLQRRSGITFSAAAQILPGRRGKAPVIPVQVCACTVPTSACCDADVSDRLAANDVSAEMDKSEPPVKRFRADTHTCQPATQKVGCKLILASAAAPPAHPWPVRRRRR